MSRVQNMIVRGVLRAARATNGYFRELSMQLPADDPTDVQHFQIHGLESRPQADAPGIAFAMSGNADHLVALIAGKNSSSIPVADGETLLYNDHGWSIWLKTDAIVFHKVGPGIRAKFEESSITIGDTESVQPFAARVGDDVSLGALVATWLDGLATAASYGAPRPALNGTIVNGSTKVRIE